MKDLVRIVEYILFLAFGAYLMYSQPTVIDWLIHVVVPFFIFGLGFIFFSISVYSIFRIIVKRKSNPRC